MHNITQDFQKDLKDNAVLIILDPAVMLYHTIVNNSFYYMISIALSVITDHLICK